ncbi:hypothetical protein RJ639_014679 [Escallonia herrerae]|uniref:hAT-like transposase RNase-H fold domain-containing protein n=1 Tax=Escallonia herrerae TaxID=1293975 RepID=A0AA89AL34_9ASTE|nr:hypothetical protein RJ639_014679 [Escallonia herrerae]
MARVFFVRVAVSGDVRSDCLLQQQPQQQEVVAHFCKQSDNRLRPTSYSRFSIQSPPSTWTAVMRSHAKDSIMSHNAEARQALAKFFGYEESRTRIAEDQRVKEVLEMLSPEFPFSLDFFGLKCLKLFEEEKDAYQRVNDIVDQIGNVYSFKDVLPTWKNRSQQLKEAQIMYRHHPMFSGRRNRALYNTPSKKGWEKVSSICDLVDDIYGIVYPLFEMGFPTANIYFHHLEELQTYLMQKSKNPNAFIRGVAEKMLQSFIKYMKDMHLVLAVASVLDPRYKMKYIEFSSSKFEGSDGELQVSMVLDAVSKLYADYVKKFPVTEESASDSAPEMEESKKYARFFKAGCCSADEGSLGWELLQEYQQYIQSAEYQVTTSILHNLSAGFIGKCLVDTV